MSLPALAQRQRAAVYLLTLLLLLGGIWALFTLPAGIYPEVAFPRIVVVATGGTFDAASMTVAVTRPLEEAMSGVIDLRRIRSKTIRGGSELSLYFRPGADMQYALQQVQGRIAGVQSDLPPGIQLTAERLTPSTFPIVQYELIGADPMVLRDYAQYTIRPRLSGLPDVGTVEVQGGLVREVSVILDPERLVSNHLSVPQAADAIRASNLLVSAGRLDLQYRQFGIVVSGLARTPDAVGNIVVTRAGDRMIRVSDLGTVKYGPEDRFLITAGNGQPAALINIARQPNGNTLVVQQGVRAVVDSLRPLLPRGMKLEVVYDQGALVRESLASVRDAMLIGGLLAIAVLLVFLGRFRVTAAAALAIPLALVITFLGMQLAGQSLNLMSLGGLAVAIGLVIDDAVVVVENIERQLHLRPDDPRSLVIRQAVEEIMAPVVGSTITTVVVFTPLGLLEGVVGDFFRAFAIALTFSVALSLFLALTLIPALLGHWVEKSGGSPGRGIPRLRLEPIQDRYAAFMRRLFPRRVLGAGLAGALLVGAFALTRVIGTGFLPTMDEGGFILDYETPTGTSLAETDRQLHVIERILLADPDIQAFSRRTGAELGLFATAQNSGDFAVLLKPRSQRKSSVYDVMDRVRAQATREAPAVRVEFVQILQDVINDLAGAPAPVEVKLFSPERAPREQAAREVADAIQGTPGLVDLFNGVRGDLPQLRVEPDPARVARLGLTVQEVGDQARASLFGDEAGSVQESDRLVPVRARLPDSVRYRPDVLARVPISGPRGWAPLSDLGTVKDTTEPAETLRENLRDMVDVTGGVEGSNLGSIMNHIRAAVSKLSLPPGVTLEYGGQDASKRAAFHQLLMVFALAVGAVMLVLVVQFGNFRAPILIMLAAILGLTGAFLGLALTGVPFNVSSFMGLILLVGLVVKNGIILLDAAARREAAGIDRREALVEAGRVRLRPILMTTLCTIAGLLPLAFGLGAGAELQKPLAIAVIGGLSLSTIVTLVLLPVGVEMLGGERAVGRGES